MKRQKGKERSKRISYNHNEPILGAVVLNCEIILNCEGLIQLCLSVAQGSVQRWVEVMRLPPLSEVSECPSLLIKMRILIN